MNQSTDKESLGGSLQESVTPKDGDLKGAIQDNGLIAAKREILVRSDTELSQNLHEAVDLSPNVPRSDLLEPAAVKNTDYHGSAIVSEVLAGGSFGHDLNFHGSGEMEDGAELLRHPVSTTVIAVGLPAQHQTSLHVTS